MSNQHATALRQEELVMDEDLTLQVDVNGRTVEFTPAQAARELGVSEEFIRRSMGESEPNAGEELDAIMRDLDATTKAWAAAGYGYGTPEDEAREAVFARLKVWNKAREVGR